MKLVLAIDPGTTHSAYVIADEHLHPVAFGKMPNRDMVGVIEEEYEVKYAAIEQIGHYGTGMPAGQDVFDTCVWIGRYWQVAEDMGMSVTLIPRRNVKIHLCGSVKATDGNIIQALVDRFAPNERNHGKGVKNQPGWFYGFHSDIWQAYSLAVYYHDTQA